MAVHWIKKGLELPISGEPRQEVDVSCPVRRVALVAGDYCNLKPRFVASVGDQIKRGQVLFEDKKMPGVLFTAPGAGKLLAINRGERRALQSVVIELTESEVAGTPQAEDFQTFKAFTGKPVAELSGEEIRSLLIESGLWTALRARPFGRVADPQGMPHSIFVTAVDSNPLAASVDVVYRGREEDFDNGLRLLTKLTDGKIYLCTHADSAIKPPAHDRIVTEVFEGKHPYGTVGLHIHLLDPVHAHKTVWHLNYQDTCAFGRLFTTGRLDVQRIVALGGPTVKKPRLLHTRIGASLVEMLTDELEPGDNRVISGSVLSGRTAQDDVLGYLGRYHLQVTAIREGHERSFLAWLQLGLNKYSIIRAFAAGFVRVGRKFAFTTTTNGSKRAIVPIGMYERVMPFDIEPVFLLKSLVAGDIERAEQLGCLELEEEDLALCSFVCPGKNDYGPILRENLDTILREG
ncbi:MAG: Na(+)-translocating NADH-quinone reductase subunit A [Phycisphaerales bacterium]|nr:Na(+)-translocating NADH-quinone reductase subunit A [Phycisphaerales bacterium]